MGWDHGLGKLMNATWGSWEGTKTAQHPLLLWANEYASSGNGCRVSVAELVVTGGM